MIKALFNSRNSPEEEIVESKPVKAPRRSETDEDELAERELVKRKARFKNKQDGHKRPRGK